LGRLSTFQEKFNSSQKEGERWKKSARGVGDLVSERWGDLGKKTFGRRGPRKGGRVRSHAESSPSTPTARLHDERKISMRQHLSSYLFKRRPESWKRVAGNRAYPLYRSPERPTAHIYESGGRRFILARDVTKQNRRGSRDAVSFKGRGSGTKGEAHLKPIAGVSTGCRRNKGLPEETVEVRSAFSKRFAKAFRARQMIGR